MLLERQWRDATFEETLSCVKWELHILLWDVYQLIRMDIVCQVPVKTTKNTRSSSASSVGPWSSTFFILMVKDIFFNSLLWSFGHQLLASCLRCFFLLSCFILFLGRIFFFFCFVNRLYLKLEFIWFSFVFWPEVRCEFAAFIIMD